MSDATENRSPSRRPLRRVHGMFNMVEVTLALGVVAIGALSVMALFPVGANASRDAIGYTHAADSASNFAHLLKNNIHENWQTLVVDGGIPSTKPEATSALGDGDLPTGEGLQGSRGTIHEFASPDGLYHLVNYVDRGDTEDELDAKDVVDFWGIAAIWQEESPVTSSKEIAVLLKIEVSWPARRPDSNRETEIFCYELFNFNQ